jgi:group I intron endonuclease
MLVYLITNNKNGKQYVGQTVKRCKERWWEHVSLGNKDKHGLLHRAIHKHSSETFKVETLHECLSKEEIDFVETFYIVLLNTKVPKGYNLTDGGEGNHGRVCSEETKEKIRAKAIGRSFSEEINASKGRKGRKRPPRTEEWCRKISENASARMAHKYGPKRTLWKGKTRIRHGK